LCVDGAVTDRLLDLTNHHPAPAPVIEQRPGRYIGYFENDFGEQLVFVHDDGEADATLYLGDVDWEPRRVSDANGPAGRCRPDPEPRGARVPVRLLDRDGLAPRAPSRIALRSESRVVRHGCRVPPVINR